MVIDAVVWDGKNQKEIKEFCPAAQFEVHGESGTNFAVVVLVIPTLEGYHRALKGDYIIKGVKGEFYPCKPDIFAKTYELVEG